MKTWNLIPELFEEGGNPNFDIFFRLSMPAIIFENV